MIPDSMWGRLMSCVHVFPVAELLDAALEEEGGTLIARKVGEAVQNTLGAVVGAIDIPLGENLTCMSL